MEISLKMGFNGGLDRIRILNAILLSELTMNDSNMDKLKYLNVLLLSEFKKTYSERKWPGNEER